MKIRAIKQRKNDTVKRAGRKTDAEKRVDPFGGRDPQVEYQKALARGEYSGAQFWYMQIKKVPPHIQSALLGVMYTETEHQAQTIGHRRAVKCGA